MLRVSAHGVIQIAQTRFSRPGALVVAALLCGLATSIPFWTGALVPLLDYPQHLALATVLHERDAPGSPLAQYFVPQWGELTPYWTLYVLLDALAFAVPMEVAGRIVLTLYAFALPWAGVVWCRSVGARAEAGLLVSALALNTNLYMGFLNFCLAAILGLVALGLHVRQHERVHLGRGLALGALSVLLFFTHAQVFAAYLAAAVAMQVLPRTGPTIARRFAAAAPVFATAFCLFVPWLYAVFIGGPHRDFGHLDDMSPTFIPVHRRLVRLGPCIAGSFHDRSDTLLLLLWAMAWLSLLALQPRRHGGHRTALAWTLVLIALCAYLVAPFSIKGQWAISIRYAFLGALLLPATLRLQNGRGARAAAILAVSLAGISGLNASLKHARWNREAAGIEEALARLPPGRRLGAVIHEPSGAVLTMAPYLHVAHYYTVRGRGVAAGSFAASGPLPVALRPAGEIDAPNAWDPQGFRCDQHTRNIDFLLSRGVGPCRLPLLFERGPWRLFAVTRVPQTTMTTAGSPAHTTAAAAEGVQPVPASGR